MSEVLLLYRSLREERGFDHRRAVRAIAARLEVDRLTADRVVRRALAAESDSASTL